MDTRLTWFVLDTRLVLETRQDPASIRTNCLDPQFVLGTRLVLEVLRYLMKHLYLIR